MSASAGCGGADQAQAAARLLPGSSVPDGEHTLCVVDTYAQAVVPLRLKVDAVETSGKRPHDESEELRDQYRIVRMLCADNPPRVCLLRGYGADDEDFCGAYHVDVAVLISDATERQRPPTYLRVAIVAEHSSRYLDPLLRLCGRGASTAPPPALGSVPPFAPLKCTTTLVRRITGVSAGAGPQADSWPGASSFVCGSTSSSHQVAR
jgi:hypothetical protein